jgi:hypothetical protein
MRSDVTTRTSDRTTEADMKTLKRYCTGAALTLTLLVATTEGVDGQLAFLSGLGYGAVGGTIGLLVTSGAECSGSQFICIPPAMIVGGIGGMVAGGALGTHLARSAEKSVERGEPAKNLGALAVGTVLGGTVLTMAVGSRILDRDGREGTVLGSPGQTAAILAVAGGGLSVLYLRSRWDELSGKSVEVAPAVVGGEAGVTVRLRF